VEIACPPKEVFAYVSDVSNLPRRQKTAISARADDELRVGAHVYERRTFQGRDIKAELEVTEYESPRRFDLKSLHAPVSYEVAHTFQPSDAGTRLDVEVDFRFGALMRVVAKAFMKPAEREFQKDFERLKQILEANARGT
jgi:uncharacterized membrane protein